MSEVSIDSSIIPVHVAQGGVIHHLVVCSYKDLIEQLQGLCFETSRTKLSYVDDEGELITVMCEADFNEAVRTIRKIGQQVLCLIVEGTGVKSGVFVNKDVKLKSDDLKSVSDFNAQCLASIETLQKKVQADLEDIQRLSSLLELRRSKTPQTTPKQKEKEQEGVDTPVKVKEEESLKKDEQEPKKEKEEEEPKKEEQKEEPSCGIIDTCNGISKKVAKLCMEVSTEPMDDASSSVSQKCQSLFDESCATTTQYTERQARVSFEETRDVTAMIHDTTDKLLDQQLADKIANGYSLKRAQELAEEVQRICASLTKETNESCSAITKCIAEMVRNT